MTDIVMFFIEPNRVSSMEFFHNVFDVEFGCFNLEVDMIGHEAIGV